jgi:hypothetical protein
LRDLIFYVIALAAAGPGETPAPAAGPPPVPGLIAEDQTPTGRFTTATEVKPILTATRANWIATRDWDGQDLIYVTHLWSWRCGLVQVEMSVNGAGMEVWPLPDCHLDQPAPNAILDGDGLPYRGFAQGSVDRIEVVITYDDLTTDRATFDGNGLLVP